MGVLPASEMANYVALGELSLDAAITALPGVLPAALAANEQGRGLICPEACGPEAAFAGEIEILAGAEALGKLHVAEALSYRGIALL
jgi:magnesium chelatase family protein